LEKSVRIFDTPYELAEKFAEEIVKVAAKAGKASCIALSGGSTPELLYSILGSHYSNSVDWSNVHFFWGDERCVPPDDPESNFGMTQRTLFKRIIIPEPNIHRILGENEPSGEAVRYSREIENITVKRDGLPVFDLIILGLGEDGHTASIFPSNSELLNSESICEVARHPVTFQNRITLTGKVINNADRVAFLVTGRKKAEVVDKILNNSRSGQNFPASRIVPSKGDLLWFLDREAASRL
jgi:6-phosphogluconolactonase